VLVIGLIADLARADAPKKSSLSWVRLEGAESCVATQPLARAVEQRLGRSVFVSAAEAELSVEGRIEKKKTGWHAHVEVRDPNGKLLGKRDLDSSAPSCDTLTSPLSLALAVMIDPDAALGGGAKPDPKPPPEGSGSTSSPGSVIVVTEPATPPRKKKELWRFETDVGFVVGPGLLPGLGFGVEGSTLLTTPLAPIAGTATATYLFENERRTGTDTSVRVSYLRGALGFCPLELELGRLVGSLCAGGGFGVLVARTTGPSADGRTQASPTLDLTFGARLSVQLVGPIVGGAATSFIIPLLRDKIAGGAFQQGPIAGLGGVFVGARIP
jgi:hypothetical protein